MDEDRASIWQRIASATGRRVVHRMRPDCGLSAAERAVVRFDDGSTAFVKAATDDATERWLRTEHAVLSAVAAPFMPAVVAWLDEQGQRPILLTRDLSRAYWPASHAGVTWRPGDLEAVFAGIAEIGRTPAPRTLPALSNPESLWPSLLSERAALERWGICSRTWFQQALPALAAAETSVFLAGDDLVHGDLRSDNVCIEHGRAVFVDWSNAARGNGEANLASILASLHLEGGPVPCEVMPGGGGWAARDAALIARRLVDDRAAPRWLREVLKRLLAINLDWAAASLGLPARERAPH